MAAFFLSTNEASLISFPFDACQEKLEAGLKAMNINVTSEQIQKLLSFLALLSQWNKRINLTAVSEPLEMVRRHLLDSASVLPYLQGQRILDVGTGAGLPGIPLSILSPEREFCLLDNNQKKQVFVSQAIKTLELNNAKPIHSLVQTYQDPQKFSTIVTRAFAPLPRMVSLTQHLLEEGGHFLAMMGKVTEEHVSVAESYQIEEIIALKVPGENAERHLAIVKMFSQK